MKNKKLYIIVGIILISTSIIFYLFYNGYLFNENSQVEDIGDKAPSFTLEKLNGDKISLSDLQSKKHCLIFGLPGVLPAGKKCLKYKNYLLNTSTSIYWL
ncbi:MAG: hypothetical protein ACOCRZ_00265 [Halothermotrichaceae bacterium]